ncbi:Ff.00g102500.m01.CDS01 [Fusarium sp. VM40]|nr:Ff.00g102500.m01.CDS01 [Fusarium sp. VM40]
MKSPSTPETHKSSSSPELDVTPPPTQQSTPFTELDNTDPQSRFKKAMNYSSLFNDSPSIRKDRDSGLQSTLFTTPAPVGLPTWNSSLVYNSQEPMGHNYPDSKGPVSAFGHVLPAQAQHPLAQDATAYSSLFARQANPVRQPAVPPIDHASSARKTNPATLAPSPDIWKSLKDHFHHLEMSEQQVPAPAPHQAQAQVQSQAPTTFTPSAQPFQLPSWLNQSLQQQPFINNNPTGTNQLENPAFRQHSTPRGFRPMAAIAHTRSNVGRVNCDDEAAEPVTFSGNYKGEHTIRNASAMNLSPEENCALWLTNLPPDVTHRQLLSQIRNVGRIWCTVINEPDYERHDTAAAKVVFFTPGPAQILLSKSLTQGLQVGSHAVRVTHNRVKYGEQPVVGAASRVLIITGKSSFVNAESLTKFFKERFVFEIDEITTLIIRGEAKSGRSVIEYRFGSFRCQAQMGKMALEKDRPDGFEKVEFGEDPCEVGDTLAAYTIAAERIQGKGI